MKKILFVVMSGDLARGGGSAIAALHLIEGFKMYKDLEIRAVVCNEGSLTERLKNLGVKYYCTSIARMSLYPQVRNPFVMAKRVIGILMRNWKVTKEICNIIDDFHPDLVHSNNLAIHVGYFAAKMKHVKHVWHIREYVDLDHGFHVMPSLGILDKWLHNSYTLSITHDVARHHGCIRESDFVVYDGVMHEDNIKWVNKKQDYFLFVGRINPEKGVTTLISAYILYSKNNNLCELWLAGSGDEIYINKIKTDLIKEGLENRVKFLGFRDDRYDLMAHARATIVPSRFEAFGFITVEAMMNGSLVIGNNTAGTRMIMKEADGCEIPYDSMEELAQCMTMVSNNPMELYTERILKAQQIANSRFTIEQCVQNTYKVYRQIINNGIK